MAGKTYEDLLDIAGNSSENGVLTISDTVERRYAISDSNLVNIIVKTPSDVLLNLPGDNKVKFIEVVSNGIQFGVKNANPECIIAIKNSIVLRHLLLNDGRSMEVDNLELPVEEN